MATVNNTLASTIDQLGLGAKPADVTKKDAMGQDAFLRLMITQMKNQNPLEPLKNQEFLAQLSQFTTASGVQGLQKSFDSLSTALQSNQALQASSLVGRSVLVASNQVYLPLKDASPNGVRGAIDLPNPVGNLQVSIHNKAGEIIRTVTLGQCDAGTKHYEWDGTDDNGVRVASGVYTVKAEAKFNDKTYSFDTAAESAVKSVTIGSNGQGMVLNLGGLGSVDIGKVKQIF